MPSLSLALPPTPKASAISFYCTFVLYFRPVRQVSSLQAAACEYENGPAAAAKSHQLCPTLGPHRRKPTRLHRPWDSPGKNTGVGCHFLLQCMKVKSESEVTQSYPTLSDPTDCNLPGSSVHGFSRQEYWSGVPLPFPYYYVAL